MPRTTPVFRVFFSSMFADFTAERPALQEAVIPRLKVYGPGVQRAGAEVGHVLVEVLGHRRDLRPGQPGDAQGLDQLVHPPGGHPEQVARRDDRGQGRFGLEVAETGSASPGDRPVPRRNADVLYWLAALGKHAAKAVDYRRVFFTCASTSTPHALSGVVTTEGAPDLRGT